jgi:hypothetical protein
VSRIVTAIPDRRLRNSMIAGTVGVAAAAEFALIADEIAANVHVADMLAASRRARATLYPDTLHGLNALIYGLIGVADKDNLPDVIDTMADLRSLTGPAFGRLPLAELAASGFELLIAKALENGWEDVFAQSKSYGAYADARTADGLI